MESCFQVTLRRQVIFLNGCENARSSGHLGLNQIQFASGGSVDDARTKIKSVKERQQRF